MEKSGVETMSWDVVKQRGEFLEERLVARRKLLQEILDGGYLGPPTGQVDLRRRVVAELSVREQDARQN